MFSIDHLYSSIKNIFFVSCSLLSFMSVFYSVGKFMYFISVPSKQIQAKDESTVAILLQNVTLLTMFMAQHTLMALPAFKEFMIKYNINVLSRSIYNFISAVLLIALVEYWKTTEFAFWNIDNTTARFTFGAIHLFAWSVIYTGCLFMDISEILGIKQVYYSIRKMPNPMQFKSPKLQRLYGHMRHPSFSAFIIIFWAYPIMSLDRYFLASVLTVYVYIAWKTDKYDLHYQRSQYARKTEELSHCQ